MPNKYVAGDVLTPREDRYLGRCFTKGKQYIVQRTDHWYVYFDGCDDPDCYWLRNYELNGYKCKSRWSGFKKFKPPTVIKISDKALKNAGTIRPFEELEVFMGVADVKQL